ncbi:hypothetical protein ACWEIJ_45070 [Lentzea sp. NPDC004789]
MWVIAQELVSRFSEQAATMGWVVDFVEDDEFALFVRFRDSDIREEIGIDLTRREFGLSLNPAISVRHAQVSELTAQFFGFEHGPAQVGESLSDLLRRGNRGQGVMWTIGAVDEVVSVVGQILSDVQEFGQEFFSQFSSLQAIVGKMEISARTHLDLGQLAVAYMIVGERVKAQSVLLRIEEMGGSQPPLLARQAQRFLADFRRYFEPL